MIPPFYSIRRGASNAMNGIACCLQRNVLTYADTNSFRLCSLFPFDAGYGPHRSKDVQQKLQVTGYEIGYSEHIPGP